LSITTICELRPLPAHADAIIQLAIEQFSLPSSNVAGRRLARLYQHVDDPTWLLYVGEWESREAFEAYRAAAPQPGSLDQYQQPPTCRVFRRLALFERMLTPAWLAYADIVTGPLASHAARRDLALAYHRASQRGQTDLALLTIYEGVDGPGGLAIVSGWQAATPLSGRSAAPEQALIEQFRATGATVEQFVGLALAETAGS
jgi:quinol monooxygenase YgiN